MTPKQVPNRCQRPFGKSVKNCIAPNEYSTFLNVTQKGAKGKRTSRLSGRIAGLAGPHEGVPLDHAAARCKWLWRNENKALMRVASKDPGGPLKIAQISLRNHCESQGVGAAEKRILRNKHGTFINVPPKAPEGIRTSHTVGRFRDRASLSGWPKPAPARAPARPHNACIRGALRYYFGAAPMAGMRTSRGPRDTFFHGRPRPNADA
jgi:hypothetical protein